MLKSKFKIILIISDILLITSLILALLFKTSRLYNMYWAIVPIVMFVLLMLIKHYDKQGKNADKIKSKNIIRNYNDTTTIATVFYFMPYLMIIFYDT